MGARRHAARRANDTAQDTATGAARPNQQRLAELDAPRVVHGSGGYTYQQHPDGALVILDGPRGKGTRIEPGGPKAAAWQAITREIGAYPRQARAPATPEGDLFQGLLQGVEHVGEVVADKVGGAVDQAGDAVNGMVHGVVDGVKHAAGDVIETVAGWWDKLTGGAKPAAPQTG
ncbi:MAG TPA: hypothetical protein PKA64_23925, partial [Myxococcota bacterium]|nr:hypothetical protein [Myxococcota bacterium]